MDLEINDFRENRRFCTKYTADMPHLGSPWTHAKRWGDPMNTRAAGTEF